LDFSKTTAIALSSSKWAKRNSKVFSCFLSKVHHKGLQFEKMVGISTQTSQERKLAKPSIEVGIHLQYWEML